MRCFAFFKTIASYYCRGWLILGMALLASPVLAENLPTPDGRIRSYTLVVPNSIKEKPAPVLFVLHGGGGSAKQIHKSLSYDALARQRGFVVVYPDGIDKHWNDGRTGSKIHLFKGKAPDDVAFLRTLAQTLIARGLADPSRIFVTGVSNGGMMTQRLMCEASDVFSGGASVIAGLPVSLNGCRPSHPRSLLLINGDHDPLMPWQGGGVGFKGRRGTVLSGPDTYSHWMKALGCTYGVFTRPTYNPNQEDNSYPVLSRTKGCKTGGQVHFIQIYGGGHNVPGIKKKGRRGKLRKKLLGETNMDFDARIRIVDFLEL
jgi:polyhydroxybutyrate depolymerase